MKTFLDTRLYYCYLFCAPIMFTPLSIYKYESYKVRKSFPFLQMYAKFKYQCGEEKLCTGASYRKKKKWLGI